MRRTFIALSALAFASALPPSAQAQTGGSQMAHPNSVQPETTLNISAEGRVTAEPDIAFVTTGVVTEARDAQAALSKNAERMNALFEVLDEAGIRERDIQTSNFSLGPRYEYPNNGKRRLVGFTARNQVTVRVRDLDDLGEILDTVVEAGGNEFGGLRFAVDDDADLLNEARRSAMIEAVARAELYADAAGYRVKRIITINESGGYRPQPQMMQRRVMASDMAESAPSPVAGGEIDYSISVNVQFELEK